jgi:hypothetical protein
MAPIWPSCIEAGRPSSQPSTRQVGRRKRSWQSRHRPGRPLGRRKHPRDPFTPTASSDHPSPRAPSPRRPGLRPARRWCSRTTSSSKKIPPAAVLRQLLIDRLENYRRPFRDADEDRRPMLSWPRTLPPDGEPAHIVIEENWPGYLSAATRVRSCGAGSRRAHQNWSNQTEVTVKGRKLCRGQRRRDRNVDRSVRRPARPSRPQERTTSALLRSTPQAGPPLLQNRLLPSIYHL